MSDLSIDFNTLFQLFLIAGIVFLGISVLLFFKDDVRGIWNARTGRGAKRAIRQMEELNAQTGKLRSEVLNHTPSVLASEDRISPPDTAARARPVGNAPAGGQDTAPLQGANQTTLLGKDANETQLLYNGLEQGAMAQTATVGPMPGETEPMSPAQEKPRRTPAGKFVITKNVMLIHTDEVV